MIPTFHDEGFLMRKSKIGSLVALLSLLALSLLLFIVVPVLLGIQTHKYLYHVLPHADPLRFFKGIAGILVVVVATVVLLSITCGRCLQEALRRARSTTDDDIDVGALSPNGPALRAVPAPTNPETHRSVFDEKQTRVLEEILESEDDPTIRQTVQDALDRRRNSARSEVCDPEPPAD